MGEQKESNKRVVYYVYIVAVLLIASSLLILGLNEKFSEILDESYLLPFDVLSPWLLILTTVIIAPFLEEISFRLWLNPKYFWAVFFMIGFLSLVLSGIVAKIVLGLIALSLLFFYKRLTAFVKSKPYVALTISSVLFSLAHLSNFNEFLIPHFILIFFFVGIGLILGMVRIQLGLWASILLHVLYNFMIVSMMLPPLSTKDIDLSGGLITEHGWIDKQPGFNSDPSLICNYCGEEELLYTIMSRAYPDHLIAINMGNQNSTHKYSLTEDQTFEIEDVANSVLEHFNFQSKISTDTVDIVYARFMINPDYNTSIENILKNKPKNFTETAFMLPSALIPFLERTYKTKIKCTEGCDEDILLIVSKYLSLQENMDQLSAKDLLEYHIVQEEQKVVHVFRKKKSAE